MSSYEHFASIYDIFMDNIPYREWADRIISIIREHGVLSVPEGDEALASEARLLVDLGCGTGVMTRLMKDAGFDCIGIDLSPEMLDIAMSYNAGSDQSPIMSEEIPSPDPEDVSDISSPDTTDTADILYLCQDMREFELYSTVGYIISVCDSINYLLTDEDVIACFKLVNNYLYPGGLFIFDFNTVHNYESIGDSTIAENRPEGSFIWENYYDPETHINEYDLTLYIREDLADNPLPQNRDDHMVSVPDSQPTSDPADQNEDDTDMYDPDSAYIRSQETHTQRGYTLDEMLGFLKKTGLQVISYIDSDTGGEITAETSRILMVSKEVSKSIIS